jgi:hypothetical protein
MFAFLRGQLAVRFVVAFRQTLCCLCYSVAFGVSLKYHLLYVGGHIKYSSGLQYDFIKLCIDMITVQADPYSCHSCLKPQLFDNQYIAKPACYAWQRTLRDYQNYYWQHYSALNKY